MENLYPIIKSLHIIAVISWMCGLLYLPRLFVYHTKAKTGEELDLTLQIMEKKLLRLIMNPAMIATFIFGFWLIHIVGFSGGWLHAKITLVIILAGFHGFLAKCRKNFEQGINQRSEKFYRIINEVPTLLMVAIIFLVILKPF
ncbi:MAG: coproporphyrinogen oxidase [Rickettsiaceae bacterium]|jgi:putative membrane protein|nr:coproporphyrinogen oxidase [Rickettsiaceae bacterium]